MNNKKKLSDSPCGWASSEFGEVKLGDERLRKRLIKLSDRLAESPESPINQACNGWAESKAAYRFFQNDSVSEKEIMASHAQQTVERCKRHKTVLAIQDTSYFTYTSHHKTTGLGVISETSAMSGKKISTFGVNMHTSFVVSTEGLPLGILDQNIFSRMTLNRDLELRKKKSFNIPIENKESYRWLESARRTVDTIGATDLKVVTVCDREGDFYELIERVESLNSLILVRASEDRVINRSSLYSRKSIVHLWPFVQALPIQGTIEVELPAKDQKPKRIAKLDVRYGSFTMNPPIQHIRNKVEKLPSFNLSAIYVVEKNNSSEEPLEWMLITNLPVTTFEEAIEKVRWYCLRWRIEVFHKILKSGLKVEQCRLQTADRLKRYLTVMSIIAWRIYWITLLARTNPDLPCTTVLADEEWKVLYSKIKRTKKHPTQPPQIREVVRWIAMLGGFLGRKGDGEPGVITLWRGWKRLFDLTEGWSLALAAFTTCG